jgi:hypothetical protein
VRAVGQSPISSSHRLAAVAGSDPASPIVCASRWTGFAAAPHGFEVCGTTILRGSSVSASRT